MLKMDVGIVTLYSLYNYGSFLQAFALQRVLEDLGHYPELICLTHWRHGWLRNRELLSSIRGLPFALRVRRAFSGAMRRLNAGGNPARHYDAVVVGSDEVWNVVNRSFHHFPQFFGIGLNTPQVIAYGPSAGRSTREHLSRIPGATDGISAMRHVSVRDDNACHLVEQVTGTRPVKVLDPTLLVDWEQDEQAVGLDRYLLVYLHRLDRFRQQEIVAFARRRGLRVVVPCHYAPWADLNLPVGPFEFLDLARRADCVVTDRFHGILFSVVYGRPFAALGLEKLKVRAALADLHLTDRAVGVGQSIESVLERPVDYSKTLGVTSRMRTSSRAYLAEALDEVGLLHHLAVPA
jgi:hypothetical protein